jgi:hypothetical protein
MKKLLDHVRKNVIAYMALFVALGGTAYASAQWTSADVKDGSLAGIDIQDNSLKGADVDESSLGQVPSAADSAKLGGKTQAEVRSGVDAATLGGKSSTDFLAASGKAADADKLDGKDSTDFLAADGTAANAAKLGGAVETTVVTSYGFAGLGTAGNTVTATCPDDGVALRGTHTEVQHGSFGFLPSGSTATYTRSSYSVEYAFENPGAVIASLRVRCLTGAVP